jgi:phospholysine phosphohistidine inorganic pyrophosphate phosphatase
MPDNKVTRNALLIDLDGVIYQSDRLVAGAIEVLEWIKQQQIPHLFATNTTSRSRASLLDKFETMGFSVGVNEIMTPVVAAAQWLEIHQVHTVALFVPADTQQDFGDLDSVAPNRDVAVDAVIIGDLGEAWDFQSMNRAFRFLMQDPQPVLIALGMTRYWRGPDGLRLDVAPFIKALEHAASCEAVVVGKPAAVFFQSSLELLKCDARQAFMIGDDIAGDIDAAQRCDIRGIQVRTGKFRDADLNVGIKPFAVLDSIADLPAWWLQIVDSNH